MTDCITYAIKETVRITTKHVVSKVISMVAMEWCKLSSLQGDVDFMRDELRSMHALLAKLGSNGDGDDQGRLDIQVREWRDEVRKLSSDIEACIGDYTLRVEDGGGALSTVGAFFRRNTRRVVSVGARHTISNKIKKLKARIHDISERRRRYNLDGYISVWDRRMERERHAPEIKQHLLKGVPSDELSQRLEPENLDVAASQLELALQKIPKDRGDQRHLCLTSDPQGGDGISKRGEEDEAGSSGYSTGLTDEAIHTHSWRPSGPRWLWISKASMLEGIGYPARWEDIQRFGHLAKKVRRVRVAEPFLNPSWKLSVEEQWRG